MDLSTVSANLKKIRKEKKLTLRELAEKSGVSNSYLSQLENGKTKNPTTEVLQKIASGLDVNFVDLIISEQDKNAINKSLKNLPVEKLQTHLDESIFLSYDAITVMDKSEKERFGESFRETREYFEISIEDISEKTGIPEKDIIALENGELNRNLTGIEISKILSNYQLFHFSIGRKSDLNVNNKEYLQLKIDIPKTIIENDGISNNIRVLSDKQALERFFNLENILRTFKDVNFNGKQIDPEYREKILKAISEIED